MNGAQNKIIFSVSNSHWEISIQIMERCKNNRIIVTGVFQISNIARDFLVQEAETGYKYPSEFLKSVCG